MLTMNSKLIYSLLNRKHSSRLQSRQQFPYFQLILVYYKRWALHIKRGFRFPFHIYLPTHCPFSRQTLEVSVTTGGSKSFHCHFLCCLSQSNPQRDLFLISSDPSHSPSFSRSISLPLSSTRYSHLPFSSHSANLHYHALDQRAVGWTVLFTGNLTHTHTHTHTFMWLHSVRSHDTALSKWSVRVG